MPGGSTPNSALRAAALCAKLPLYRSFRRYGYPTLMPLSMSFVVTDRCNSLCKTCNIGQRFRDDPQVVDGELDLDEYTRLFDSISGVEWVTFSGGEPFMRPDFPEIVARLAERVKPRVINVPTNASLVRATTAGAAKILSRAGDTKLTINVSVDGVGSAHDDVRGFEGNFALLEKTLRELRRMDDPRLTIGVNTVLSRFNAGDAATIFDFVLEHLRPDSYVLELAQIRPEYHNLGDRIAPPAHLARAAIDAFVEKTRARRRRGVARVVSAFRNKYYADVKRTLEVPQGHDCYSGFGTCAVMSHGDVWTNTQRGEVLGNLRDFAMDFSALWRSTGAVEARANVRAKPCHCETSNVAYTNALLDLRGLPGVLYHFVVDA